MFPASFSVSYTSNLWKRNRKRGSESAEAEARKRKRKRGTGTKIHRFRISGTYVIAQAYTSCTYIRVIEIAHGDCGDIERGFCFVGVLQIDVASEQRPRVRSVRVSQRVARSSDKAHWERMTVKSTRRALGHSLLLSLIRSLRGSSESLRNKRFDSMQFPPTD